MQTADESQRLRRRGPCTVAGHGQCSPAADLERAPPLRRFGVCDTPIASSIRPATAIPSGGRSWQRSETHRAVGHITARWRERPHLDNRHQSESIRFHTKHCRRGVVHRRSAGDRGQLSSWPPASAKRGIDDPDRFHHQVSGYSGARERPSPGGIRWVGPVSNRWDDRGRRWKSGSPNFRPAHTADWRIASPLVRPFTVALVLNPLRTTAALSHPRRTRPRRRARR